MSDKNFKQYNNGTSLSDLGYEAREGKDGIDIWDIKLTKIIFHLEEYELFQNSTPEKIYQLVLNKINGN